MTPFHFWMRKQADCQPGAFDSRTVPDIDWQGSGVDPTIKKGSPFAVTAKRGTSDGNVKIGDEDVPTIEEPRSPSCGDRGGGAMG